MVLREKRLAWPPGRGRARRCRPASPTSAPPPHLPVRARRRHADAADSRRASLRKAFTPTHPLRSARRLAGRGPQLARVLRAVLDEAAHVVIYAERGRGKTSLTNLVAEALRSLGFMVASYTCAADDDFDAILRGLLRSLPRSLLVVPAQHGEERYGRLRGGGAGRAACSPTTRSASPAG